MLAYINYPNGLLILDRAEPRTDKLLEVYFWDLKKQKLVNLTTLKGSTAVTDGFFGFRFCAVSLYEHKQDACIVGGFDSYYPNKLDIMDNVQNELQTLVFKVR